MVDYEKRKEVEEGEGNQEGGEEQEEEKEEQAGEKVIDMAETGVQCIVGCGHS